MRPLFIAVAVLSTSAAFAQVDDDDAPPVVNVQVPGMNVQINTGRGPRVAPPSEAPPPAPAPAVRQPPPPRAFGGDQFSVEYGPLNGVSAASLKVVGPEAALAEVWADDGSLVGSYSVPFIVTGRSGQYLRVILMAQNGGLILDKKFELKQFVGGLISLRGAVAPPPPPVRPVPVVEAVGMPASDFADLLKAVEDASFGKEKLGVIELAAKHHSFTVDQVGQLVDLLSFSNEKIGVIELTRAHLADSQHAFLLLDHFTFAADKQKVRQLLK